MAVLQSIKNLFYPSEAVEETIVPAPTTDYIIEPLSIDDIDRLLRLNLRCFKQGENYTKHTFNYLLTQPQSIGLMAQTSAGEMAGFVLLMNNPDGAAHITTVGVAPEHRRRGVASALIDELETILRKKEVSTVVLEVRVGNTAAQDLYSRAGYSVVKRMIRYYHNGEDGFLMMKSLI
ncbi:MAG: ribosomal protein S18-alanine N-acetyltransferase [Pyrinomonadaceae bacterium]